MPSMNDDVIAFMSWRCFISYYIDFVGCWGYFSTWVEFQE